MSDGAQHVRAGAPARRRPTLRMVAELAGVSTATVSYVFSGRDGGASGAGVASETARRVRDAAEKLNYRPNRAAQAVRTGRSGMVQLSLHMLSDPWSLAVVEAVNEEANKHGLTTLILADGDWHAALDRVESDVAYLDDPSSDGNLRDLVRRGQRLVVFSETLEPDGFDVIRSNPIPGCGMAMDHLLERRTAIGCLAWEKSVELAGEKTTRYTAYLQRMAAAGLDVDPTWTSTFGEDQASAFEAAVRLLSRADRPDAIYATTDFAAIAAINAAHMLGLNVPHDVAVIGIGNTPAAQRSTPTLTTVGPTDFFARQAQIIVDRALGIDDAPARVHEFEWSLFPGASTALGVRTPA